MRIFPLTEDQKKRLMELKLLAEHEMAIARKHAANADASRDAIREILDAAIGDENYQRSIFRGPQAYIDQSPIRGVTEDFAYVIAEKKCEASA